MPRAWVLGILICLGAGCHGGPPLPDELSFEGSELEKAGEWTIQDVRGVFFVPPGEEPQTASIQVGLLASEEHSTGADLHTWTMEQYHSFPAAQWFESTTADEACKVGLPPGPPRPFVAIHVCRTGARGAACAEADQRLDDSIVGRCLNDGWDCWDELCTQKWDQWRPELEELAFDVVGRR